MIKMFGWLSFDFFFSQTKLRRRKFSIFRVSCFLPFFSFWNRRLMMTDDFFSPSGFHKPLGWTNFLFLLSAFLLFSIVRKTTTKNLVGYWKSSRLNASINILIAASILLLERDERKPQKIRGEEEEWAKKNTKYNHDRARETTSVVQSRTDIRSDSCRQSRQAITTVMQREIRAKHKGPEWERELEKKGCFGGWREWETPLKEAQVEEEEEEKKAERNEMER